MEKAKALYFKSNKLVFDKFEEKKFKTRIWRPSLFSPLPPGKPFKYIILTLLYALKLIPNKNYLLIELLDKEEVMSSILVVPKFEKFKYMGKNDIQFIYVMVKEKFRGQNLAIHTIKESLAHLKKPVDNYWYVTNRNNIASIRVAEKLGFKLENIE